MADERKLTWLHLSDLHLRAEGTYEQDLVLRALLTSLRQYRDSENFSPDLIFVTGDIAHSGKVEEYRAATEFFTALLETTSLSKSHLVVIPGNHDVDRAGGRSLIRSLASEVDSVDYFSPSHPKDHFRKFQNYTQWHNAFFSGTRTWLPQRTCQPPILIAANGLQVAALLVNSALFSLDDSDYGQLWIGRRAADEMIEELQVAEYDLCVCLVHHPFDWLHPDERSSLRSKLTSNSTLILRGHLHEFSAESIADQNGNTLTLASGACYQTRKHRNTALFGTYRKQQHEMRIRCIRYEDQPELWTLDPSIFPRDPQFERTISLGGKVTRSPRVQGVTTVHLPAFHLGSVVPPEYFVGRRQQLTDAQRLIRIGQSFLVVGSRRSGKTSFTRKLMSLIKKANDSDATSRSVLCYLNLERDARATISTFLEHVMLNMLSESARQVFGKTFADLELSASGVEDPRFATLQHIYSQLAKRSSYKACDRGRAAIIPDEFVECVKDLMQIIRPQGWHRYVVFLDEANHLPRDLSLELLVGNADALTTEHLTTVCAASPEMAGAFGALGASFSASIDLAQLDDKLDVARLVARYYFDDIERVSDIPVEADALARVWECASGLPYQTQCILWFSFKYARDEGAPAVTWRHVRDAHALLAQQRPEYFSESGQKST